LTSQLLRYTTTFEEVVGFLGDERRSYAEKGDIAKEEAWASRAEHNSALRKGREVSVVSIGRSLLLSLDEYTYEHRERFTIAISLFRRCGHTNPASPDSI
jgi:hypothetical protein